MAAGASSNWTDAQVFKLIDAWGDEDIQEQLEGSKRNKHVYERMAEALRTYGIEKSGEQCRTKVKKLRQEYKKMNTGRLVMDEKGGSSMTESIKFWVIDHLSHHQWCWTL